MKKVGMITMHQVWNAGSALQAYALQYIIETLGYEAKLIDYKYPNLEHAAFSNNIKEVCSLNFKGALKVLFYIVRSYFVKSSHRRAYTNFYERYFKRTDLEYVSRKSLLENPPQFDIYVTGSDQVWNPQYVGFDTSYLLDFVPEHAKRLSYASSFSTNNIPSYMHDDYARCLIKYDNISVREQSGKRIVEGLIHKNATVCCDPTLLLDDKQWGNLACESIFKVSRKYILVYIMGYAYNPYPMIYQHIDSVSKKLKLPVLFYNTRRGKYKAPYGEIKVDGLGPLEFLWLFQNAAFVVTDSFHGTAFSLNFKRPFISVIEKKDGSDSRVYNLLETTGTQHRAILCSKPTIHDEVYQELTTTNEGRLNELRRNSKKYLQDALKF